MSLPLTLLLYLAALLAIGAWAARRTADSDDFHLGGRRLGPFVASLSASASSSSAWSLLGVSGAAYAWGLPAIWLLPAVLSGFWINWTWIAPRLKAHNDNCRAMTLVEFLSYGLTAGDARRLRRGGALIILFSFTFYIASQFQAAGVALGAALPVGERAAIAYGAVIVVGYVLLGGFWAASVTDALQGMMMALVALILPLIALAAAGGAPGLWHGLAAAGGGLSWTAQSGAIGAALFVAGLFGIGLGYPGQPHVVNRFMALAAADSIRLARRLALGWAAVIYSGMIVLGWAMRVLAPALADRETALIEAASLLLPATLTGIVTGGVLAAIMSTADSQLLVAGSAVSHDFSRRRPSLAVDRLVVLLLGAAAVLIAWFFPSTLFRRVLFAWQALGNAFGPLLIVLLWRGPPSARARLWSMTSGFALTVGLSLLPDAPGDAAERLLPFATALAIAYHGSAKRVY